MAIFKGIRTATVTVTTAGTAAPLTATPIYTTSVLIQADEDNIGAVFVGDSDVSSATGISLNAGEDIEFSGDDVRGIAEEVDLSDIFVDAEVNGEQVQIVYYIRKRSV